MGASRMNSVLCAARDDVMSFSTGPERIDHLLGLTIAIRTHGIWPSLVHGDEKQQKLLGNNILKVLANEWKKFFEPCYAQHYQKDDRYREYAKDQCGRLQDMLKSKTEPYAKKHLFNYIRIPRPKKSKSQEENEGVVISLNFDLDDQRNINEADARPAKKKRKKKPTAAMQLVERIGAVKGVAENEVHDSCPELRQKIKSFLQRDGMT